MRVSSFLINKVAEWLSLQESKAGRQEPAEDIWNAAQSFKDLYMPQWIVAQRPLSTRTAFRHNWIVNPSFPKRAV